MLLAPDYTKAFAIFLVVTGHSLRGLVNAGIIEENLFWLSLDSTIYLFHMPLFFYVSGLFFEENFAKNGARKMTANAVRILIVPLVIWSYIQFGLQYLVPSHVNNPVSINYLLWAPFPPRQQFWFLAVLFVCIALSSLLLLARNKRKNLLWLLGASSLLNLMFYDSLAALGGLSQYHYLCSQFLIHLPYFLMPAIWGVKEMQALKIGAAPLAGVLALTIAIYLMMPEISVWHSPVRFVAAALCVFCVYKIADALARAQNGEQTFLSSLLCFIGMNSMIIFLAHIVFSAGMRTALLLIGVDDGLVHFTLGTLAGYILPLALIPLSIHLSRSFPGVGKYVLPFRLKRG